MVAVCAYRQGPVCAGIHCSGACDQASSAIRPYIHHTVISTRTLVGAAIAALTQTYSSQEVCSAARKCCRTLPPAEEEFHWQAVLQSTRVPLRTARRKACGAAAETAWSGLVAVLDAPQLPQACKAGNRGQWVQR